jgi:hypothetical protein
MVISVLLKVWRRRQGILFISVTQVPLSFLSNERKKLLIAIIENSLFIKDNMEDENTSIETLLLRYEKIQNDYKKLDKL